MILCSQAPARNVLIVEDDCVIAMDLATCLQDQGLQIVGPAYSVANALELAGTETHLDMAVLDIKVGHDSVFDVADTLLSRHVPFVFTTGQRRGSIPEKFRNVPHYERPIDSAFIAADLAAKLRHPSSAKSRQALQRIDSVYPVPAWPMDGEAAKSLQAKCILLVEHNDALRSAMHASLQDAGCEVIDIHHIRPLHFTQFDAAIVDLNQRAGQRLLIDELSAAGVPIVLICAPKSHDATANGVPVVTLQKPFTEAELLRCMVQATR